MKKIVTLIICVIAIIGLTGCGKKDSLEDLDASKKVETPENFDMEDYLVYSKEDKINKGGKLEDKPVKFEVSKDGLDLYIYKDKKLERTSNLAHGKAYIYKEHLILILDNGSNRNNTMITIYDNKLKQQFSGSGEELKFTMDSLSFKTCIVNAKGENIKCVNSTYNYENKKMN